MRHRCSWMVDATRPCDQHGTDCPDVVVIRSRTGAYGIPIRDGGGSFYLINNCPGCGANLLPERGHP